MPEMNWTTIVQIGGGTALSAVAESRSAEAIDTIEVTLAPGDAGKTVDIQPGGAKAIHLLVIKSSFYGPDLRYVASDGEKDSAALVLDEPHVFSGGSLALLGLDPFKLKFTNNSPDKQASVTVFVARDATP
jgi:hypothetical protein